MPINQLNLSQTYGRGVYDRERSEFNALRQDAFRQETQFQKKTFDEAQIRSNTEFVAKGAEYVMQNPDGLAGFIQEGERRGVFKPGFAENANLQQLLDTLPNLHQSAMAALGGPQQPAATSGIKEYQFAKSQGYEGSFADWKSQNKSGININTGTIPPGYQITYDDEGRPLSMSPISGGPVDPTITPTSGQTAVDAAFAKEFVTFKTGGFADAQKGIVQLRAVEEQLLSGKVNITGPGMGKVPDVALSLFNPRALAAREDVEEVVQRNLRLILGAQFTEKEGERLIARAFNPNLDEAINAKRVKRLLLQMELALKAKQDAADYFEKNGTLRGWAGDLPSVDDFYAALEGGGDDEPPKISTTEEYNALPSGTKYTDPTGQVRTKQ